ncbi:hypothetical protein L2E82_02277 [Cichorium intybus]|uniref:Uncharacterized protein n=1 Tax=Cichorium intybus TaxID=13427 RepID=A0ACB9H177_CICIN|nr:hypothetical protein L2E82_02277 [Cichorium intybus]
MDSTGHNRSESSHSPPPTAIHFPVNYDQPDQSYHDKRIDEVDFFIDKKHDLSKSTDYLHRKESTAPTIDLDLNINTRLNLLTGNTRSDQSLIDDGISPSSEDKRITKHELVTVQAQLERMNGENQRLREALNQVIVNYNTLENHLATIIQQKQGDENPREDGNGEGSTRERRSCMDLALAAPMKKETGENLQSSSEERNHDEPSRSMNNKTGAIDGEENPEQGSQVQRLNSSNYNNRNTGNMDQSPESTVRKARVSVRARSEASVVFIRSK